MGTCPFCDEAVLVDEGEMVKFMNDNPTHFECRKDFGINEEWI